MKKYDIFDLLKGLEQKSEKIKSVFDCSDFLDHEISILWEIIEAGYGLNQSDEGADILYKFGNGKISKEKAKLLLRKLSKKLT